MTAPNGYHQMPLINYRRGPLKDQRDHGLCSATPGVWKQESCLLYYSITLTLYAIK